MVEIDRLDREILDILSEDSRLSYREVAKRLGVSHASVSTRIRRLEDEKVIRGYTTVVDPESLGMYPMCVRISAGPGASLSDIGREVAKLSKTYVVLRVSGDCELLALGMCADKQEALEMLSEISEIEEIEKAESHVVLKTLKMMGKHVGEE